ncbi:unnamed protein product [Calicophoron daubneyi]|uniref:Uncharacterized protein n=1 Tax=Calicophoron daubneyi TaxID=300641 RepID=A0AAV2TFS7_CALDB
MTDACRCPSDRPSREDSAQKEDFPRRDHYKSGSTSECELASAQLLTATTEPLNPISGNSHYHHRRKRIRISPLSRSVPKETVFQSGEHSLAFGSVVGLGHDGAKSLPNEMISSPNIDPLASPLNPLEEDSTNVLNLNRIDPELRMLICKYVRSEAILRCLELAGFTSPYVLACLDEVQIRHLEEFVGHACSLMNSTLARESFIGPIFAKYPGRFKLPSGAVCGLLLATAEIKRRYCDGSLLDSSCPDHGASRMEELTDMGCQTDISIPPGSNQNRLFAAQTMVLGTTHPVNTVLNVNCTSPKIQHSQNGSTDVPARNFGEHHPTKSTTATSNANVLAVDSISTVTSTTDTVAMMAAAFQAAAVAATSCSSYGQSGVKFDSSASATSENGLSTSGHLPNSAGPGGAFGTSLPSDTNTVMTSVQNAVRLVAAVSGCAVQNSTQPCPPVMSSTAPCCMFEEEVIDLERLKQHSSASAIRLASRQFVNAHLTRGRDFDMEMEVSITQEGLKRVTGIFYCHLCREKRERTSAVRFSIARNRYPVLSNVLSHLKTHFQYRGQVFTVGQSTYQNTNCLQKGSYMFGDSNVATGSSTSALTLNSSPGLAGLGLNAASYPDLTNSMLDLSHLNSSVIHLNSSGLSNNCSNQQSALALKSEQVDDRVSTAHIQQHQEDSTTSNNTSGSDARTNGLVPELNSSTGKTAKMPDTHNSLDINNHADQLVT